jgi:hypothetical protein
MTPSPYKRDRRQKSRLQGHSDSDRANLRQKALDLASKGLNTQRATMEQRNHRGGPVDHGPADAQRKAAEQIREKANNERRVTSHGGAPKDPVGGLARSLNQTGNERSGKLFRRIPRAGGEVHDYGNGKRVFVRKPKQGEGARPETGRFGRGPLPKSGTKETNGTGNYDQQVRDLARRRATENVGRAKRKLFRARKAA